MLLNVLGDTRTTMSVSPHTLEEDPEEEAREEGCKEGSEEAGQEGRREEAGQEGPREEARQEGRPFQALLRRGVASIRR